MREIKFRAWDDEAKTWLFGYELPNLGGFHMEGEVVLMGEWGAEMWNRISTDRADTLKLMQYTGLKDKNGVEIYEGDILARKNVTVWEQYTDSKGDKWNRMTDKKTDHIASVFYDSSKAAFATGNSHLWLAGNYPDIEVIGNIYATPELLK